MGGGAVILACNGVAVPLSSTGTEGGFVGGVRFKAWDPPQALHPTIAAQTPLVFDVYDRWSGRALGGMTHHVLIRAATATRRSRSTPTEAEARRRARFEPIGHTPGPIAEPVGHTAAEHPRTLDLRAAV